MHNSVIEHASKIDRIQDTADARPYALGYSEGEFRRLERQGALYRDLTEDVLRRAGIAKGMRVLDIGCGVGDVSLIAGELVGPSGFVLGVDRSAEAVDMAERRAVEAGQCHWVRFTATELEAFSSDETFDAVIGRLILLYLADPVASVRRLAANVRPGGIIAFQEMAMPMIRSVPDGPLFRQCRNWVLGTIERSGFEPDMGGKLFETLLASGLPAPQMIAAARVEGGPELTVYDYMAETLRSLLPVAERVGVTTADEVGIDTLAERLRREALERTASIMLPPLIGAWTRTPEQSLDKPRGGANVRNRLQARRPYY